MQNVRSSEKTYTCPGCHQPVPAGSAHVVAWATESLFGREAALAARRHWHLRCWG